MNVSNPAYALDADFACAIALGTGNILLAAQQSPVLTGHPLGKTGDELAQTWLTHCIHTHRPRDIVLSEEAADPAARLHADRVWIIDPLDGTRYYAQHHTDWSIHIGLWTPNNPLMGVVYIPASHTLVRSDTVPPACTYPPTGTLLLSPSLRSDTVTAFAQQLNLHPHYRGSAGVKAMLVVEGKADAYVHIGGQYEWDSCAPTAIARAAGLHCSRLDGSPLLYNQTNTFLPDIVICRPELAEPIITLAHTFFTPKK